MNQVMQRQKKILTRVTNAIKLDNAFRYMKFIHERESFFDACKHDDVDRVKYLLSKGVDVNTRGKGGCTALMLAAEHGSTSSAQALISYGAEVDAKDNRGWTALMISVINGQTLLARALIVSGANVNEKKSDGFTMLMDAVIDGNESLTLALINAGADVNARDDDGYSIVDLADQCCRFEISKILKAFGAKGGAQHPTVQTLPLNLVFGRPMAF